MDKIGSSYIALPDLIICSVAFALIYSLTTLPPNSLVCRTLAVISGGTIVAITVIIIAAANLSRDGVGELATVGISLALALFRWNDARVELNRAAVTPPEFLK